jgi:drug/metabolite transporter (DMT)-like permease
MVNYNIYQLTMTSTEKLSSQPNLEENDLKKVEQLPTLSALVLLFIALIALSLAAIFIRFSEMEISSNATVFNRLWIAMTIFGVGSGIKQIQLYRSKDLIPQAVNLENFSFLNNLKLLLIMGVTSSIYITLWAWSLTQTSFANSIVLRSLTPVFTTFFGWLFLGQYFETTFLVGIAIALCGAIVIGITDFSYSTNNITGDVAALLAAIFYGVYLLSVEKLRTRFSSSTILLWRCFIGTVLTLPIVILSEQPIFPYSLSGWLAVISQAVVCQVLGQGLLAQSLNQLSSGFVATSLLLEPMITAFIAWVIFSEQLTFINCIAFCIVLLGVYLAKPRELTINTKE